MAKLVWRGKKMGESTFYSYSMRCVHLQSGYMGSRTKYGQQAISRESFIVSKNARKQSMQNKEMIIEKFLT